MQTTQDCWQRAERDDHAVLWVMIAGIVIGAYLAIAI